ncbi:MAG TPA: hypothetical protein EYG02_14590 [Henriciella marina]|uniref:hypothetical protein n=1 Tax=Henriciella sp. TaxID=1968823 RepID=UPI0017FFA496|nr:hypothetical protein [Henriciella sp.]HIG23029.1 hypothetical protein [Henriciella sp.]HIK66237.1 hypothetical protein [Henriciella marina]
MTEPQQTPPPPLDDEARQAQKRRNWWLALALFAFVILVGVTTVVRLADSELGPDGGFYWSNPPQSDSQPMPDLPAADEARSDEEGSEQ